LLFSLEVFDFRLHALRVHEILRPNQHFSARSARSLDSGSFNGFCDFKLNAAFYTRVFDANVVEEASRQLRSPLFA
jgi:hypothetical protein